MTAQLIAAHAAYIAAYGARKNALATRDLAQAAYISARAACDASQDVYYAACDAEPEPADD